jgi:hypothetical protein
MGHIMHDATKVVVKKSFGVCNGGIAKAYGKDSRCEQTFWSYVIFEWVPKCEMWASNENSITLFMPFNGQRAGALSAPCALYLLVM